MYIIGYVVKPHGIRGEVKVQPISPDPNRFYQLKKVFLRMDVIQAYSIQKTRVSNRFVFLKLSGVDSRNEAEILRDCEILIEKEDLIDLPSDGYFIHDLIGCEMITIGGKTVGNVVDILQMASNDVYVVNDDSGKEILVPAIKDVIKEIDIKRKKIRVHLFEGIIY